MRMLNPPHPGTFIKTEVIEPLNLSVSAAATVLGVSRPTLSTFLNGRSDLSGTMALRIEKAFGVKMDTLMRMQASYDIARTRKQEATITVHPLPSNPGEPVERGTPVLVFPLVAGWTLNWLAASRATRRNSRDGDRAGRVFRIYTSRSN